jgi:DNA-binding HxlR family transcriptional regulator
MKLEKITDTKAPDRSGARPAQRYKDACASAHAMEIIGERWALLVMRELHVGPRRFSDIKASLPGISANVLTQRLEGLELAGIVRRRFLPAPVNAQVYELTEWGLESEEILKVLGRWASRSPWHDPTQNFSAASFMLSLRTMFSPDCAEGVSGTINFVASGTPLVCRIAGKMIDIHPGEAETPDLTLVADGPVLAGFIYGGAPLSALEAEAGLTVTGDRSLAERLPNLFPLPEKAPPPEGVTP